MPNGLTSLYQLDKLISHVENCTICEQFKQRQCAVSLCSVKRMTEVVIGALTGVVALVNFLLAEDTPKMFCLLFSEDQARRHKMCLPVIGNLVIFHVFLSSAEFFSKKFFQKYYQIVK